MLRIGMASARNVIANRHAFRAPLAHRTALLAAAAVMAAAFAFSGLSASMPEAAPAAAETQDTVRFRVHPERLELQLDGSAQLRFERVDARGAASHVGGPVTWFSQAPEVAVVDPDGSVRAMGVGQARITARSAAGVAVALVDVPVPAATRVEASIPVLSLIRGTSAPVTLELTDARGRPAASDDIRFESRDPAVAEVDATGRLQARAAGQTTILVTAGAARTELPVRVAPDPGYAYAVEPERVAVRTGDVVRLRIRARGADGTDGPTPHPAWTLSGTGAQVDAEGKIGVFVAEEPGRYPVTAVIGEEQVRTAVVEVTARESAATIELTGRGTISEHHSGDMWVFEGVDGRDYVYIGTYMHDWMKVFDVTDPTHPVLTDSVWMDARRINDVKIHPDNRLAVVTREGASNRRNGIVILDLRNPAHPVVLSEYTETVTGGVHNVWLEGDLVYAAHNGTSDVHILDLSDPGNVREVGRWGLDRVSKTLHDVIVQDGYAYLSYWDDGIVMLDAGAGTHGGTPTEPTFVSRYSYPIGSTHVAWRAGRYLFVGDELFPPGWNSLKPIEARGFIHVIDYDDPENPVEVARYEVPEAGAHNVWVEDDLLYVGYYQAGLRVVDISGELRGDLYRQGREIAVIRTTDEHSMVPNWPMTWGAQPHKGHIFSSDLNSGLWVTKLERGPRPVF
jgi:hypothetical protein